jgi:hypothetical protein
MLYLPQIWHGAPFSFRERLLLLLTWSVLLLYTESCLFNMAECRLAPTSTRMPGQANQHPDAGMDKPAPDAG